MNRPGINGGIRLTRAQAEQLSFVVADAGVELGAPDMVWGDMRGPLIAYVLGTARIYGRSTAEQLRVFLDNGDELFAELFTRATGMQI